MLGISCPGFMDLCTFSTLQRHVTLQLANPTCYHRIMTLGFVVLTADADVTRTLALTLCEV